MANLSRIEVPRSTEQKQVPRVLHAGRVGGRAEQGEVLEGDNACPSPKGLLWGLAVISSTPSCPVSAGQSVWKSLVPDSKRINANFLIAPHSSKIYHSEPWATAPRI